MKGRTFSDLERTMNRKKLRRFIKEVAEFYANSEYGKSHSYITKYYNITSSCYEKILDKAISWNIVDDVTIQKIVKKKCYNTTCNSGSSTKVYDKYIRLLKERDEYKGFPFSKKEAIKIAVIFTEDEEITKKILADIYCVTPRDIDNALYVASAKNWIDDKLFEKLKEQSLKNNYNPKDIKFFESLEELRKRNK